MGGAHAWRREVPAEASNPLELALEPPNGRAHIVSPLGRDTGVRGRFEAMSGSIRPQSGRSAKWCRRVMKPTASRVRTLACVSQCTEARGADFNAQLHCAAHPPRPTTWACVVGLTPRAAQLDRNQGGPPRGAAGCRNRAPQ